MKFSSVRSNFSALLIASVAATTLVYAEDLPAVPYPDGFRSWRLVKTKIVGPESKSFQTRGGIHHFWANEQAVEGYRTGRFPNGSVLIEEIVVAKEGEGDLKGTVLEGELRSLDVMVKNDALYKDTNGWAFDTFKGDSKTASQPANVRAQCLACHARQKDKDFVFTQLRQ